MPKNKIIRYKELSEIDILDMGEYIYNSYIEKYITKNKAIEDLNNLFKYTNNKNTINCLNKMKGDIK